MKYRCPYAYKSNSYKFLTCKLLIEENLDDKQSALSAVCAYQHICPETRQVENTSNAKKCYEYHSKKS
mgnify:CR=1 FL=1